MRHLCYTAGMATITLEGPDEMAPWLDDGTGHRAILLRYALELAFFPAEPPVTQGFHPWGEVAALFAGRRGVKALLDFRFSAGCQGRFVQLLEVKDKAALTPPEESDLSSYRQALWFLSYLKTHLHLSAS